MYVCMCVCLFFLLMKGSFSFDPNNVNFTQKIDECSRRVMHYIPPKTVQNWLKNQFFKKGLVFLNYERLALVEMGQDFSIEFSFADRLQGSY